VSDDAAEPRVWTGPTTIHRDPATRRELTVPVDPGTRRALLPLTLHGHPVLMAPAEPVTQFGGELADLVDDMFATMYAAPGVGLAAPQVGVGLALFVFDCGNGRVGHVCNPQLETVPGELQEDDEGCLSVPDLWFATPRAMQARVTGCDVHGAQVEFEGRGLLARCLQHETDHLSGRLYLDRLGGKVGRRARREVTVSQWYGEHLKVLVPAELPEGGRRHVRPREHPSLEAVPE
jgi:peptide deformylase